MNFVMVLNPRPSRFATGAIVPEELRRQPSPVGMISLVDIDLVHRHAEPAHLLIGEEDAVKGIPVAFEATKLIYQLAFDTLGLHRVYGPIASGNKGMLRFHLNLGMTEEGRQRDHYFLNGRWHDAVLVGMLEDEYRTIALPKLNRMIEMLGDKT
jgi:diamine N-acetyltransferase